MECSKKEKEKRKQKTTQSAAMTPELSIHQYYSDSDEQLIFADPNKIIMLNSIS